MNDLESCKKEIVKMLSELFHENNLCPYALLGHRIIIEGVPLSGPPSMSKNEEPFCMSSSCFGGLKQSFI